MSEIPKSTPDSGVSTDYLNALARIRERLEQLAEEYASGALNSAQFNAMYRHYVEQRMIIEKLVERNPGTEAWRSAALPGRTIFLRNHYRSNPVYFAVFNRNDHTPLATGGWLPRGSAHELYRVLLAVWRMEQWPTGLARKALGNGAWLVLVIGPGAMTVAIFVLQPSDHQISQVRDLHDDFERANRLSLERGMPADKMVFPQRALLHSPY